MLIVNSYLLIVKPLQRYNFYLNYPTFPHKKNIYALFNNFSTKQILLKLYRISKIYTL